MDYTPLSPDEIELLEQQGIEAQIRNSLSPFSNNIELQKMLVAGEISPEKFLQVLKETTDFKQFNEAFRKIILSAKYYESKLKLK